jgi:hypothetical protein
MAEFASNAKGNVGVTLGAIGTGLGALSTLAGGVLPILGGNSGDCHQHVVNRYEMELQQQISSLKSDVALRDANVYNDQKILEVYKYFDGKIADINGTLAQQAVYNATNTAQLGCMANQIAQLFSLTKLVVPNSSVCPGWGNVAVSPATTPTT